MPNIFIPDPDSPPAVKENKEDSTQSAFTNKENTNNIFKESTDAFKEDRADNIVLPAPDDILNSVNNNTDIELNENQNAAEEGPEGNSQVITWDDIARLVSGINKRGEPRAYCGISIDDYTSEIPGKVQNIVMSEAVFQVYIRGGSVIVEAEFPPGRSALASSISDMCIKYIREVHEYEEKHQFLSMLVVPEALGGAWLFMLSGITYFNEKKERGGKRTLIFAFNHEETMEFSMDAGDVPLQEIRTQIIAEVKRLDEEAENAYFAAKEEYEKANNPYEQSLQEMIRESTSAGFESENNKEELEKTQEESSAGDENNTRTRRGYRRSGSM